MEAGESYIDTAVRETMEETGIKVKLSDIDKTPHRIEYINKRGKIYKTLVYFIVRPVKKITVDNSKIQLEEVDWVGFCDKTDAMIRIFWRFEEMLSFID
jgi:8-oxo-dGTP pyrophosphatase MutT (NUDIX family)